VTKAQGVEFGAEADESAEGPGSFMTTDPDGNPILVDQHRQKKAPQAGPLGFRRQYV
jgi:hypothetical protein